MVFSFEDAVRRHAGEADPHPAL